MAEKNVITLMLDDLSQEQPIRTAISIGDDLQPYATNYSIQWSYFNVSEFLNLPFTKRYDLAFVLFNTAPMREANMVEKRQLLVRLRDLFARKVVVVCSKSEAQILRSLGFTQLISQNFSENDRHIWQFNIQTYKHIPDWLNAKFWANPENWNKFRW